MEENRNDKRRGGFTLVETLLVTAILMILLGLSLVGVARYRDYLKITELDNEAREIFMAAENRAVLLENSGESVSLLGEKQEETADPIKLSNREPADDDELAGLLPAGVIDPALRDGHFIVLYDASTHHVKEVFYAEGDIESNLDLFRQSRSTRVSYYREDTSSHRLVGWYSGGKAENIGTKPLPTPGVEVLIENSEELTLTVRYTMPEGLPAGVDVVRTPSVTLKYGGKEIDLWTSGRKEGDSDITQLLTTGAEYVWVLDSLEKDAGEVYSKQFKKLGGGLSDLGGSFTVTAGLKLEADGNGYIDSTYYAQGTDNSLFAKETGDEDTAYIANVRHLQNLCMDFSGASAGITKAEQLTDIECKEYKSNQGTVLDPNYNFIPIANGALTSYDGKTKTISGLYVSCCGDAGLFGLVTKEITIQSVRLFSPRIISTGGVSLLGESNAAPLLARVDEEVCTLKDIEVVNGFAGGKTYVGGLVGLVNSSASCNLENCRVYWTAPGELVKGSGIDYKISGKHAGGLIGYASGAASIEGSFAAATVKGDTGCGGLVGLTGTKTLAVSGSYADCYLTGSAEIGGLVGQSKTAPTLANCYAAGFIVEPAGSLKTAGLVNGTVGTVRNCYSAVRVLKDSKLERPATLLSGDLGAGSGSVRYLYTAAEVTANQFGSAFEYEATKPETHVYNLRHRLNLTANPTLKLTPPYPFPGLKGLPHYGDWAELNVDPVPAGLAYYETYSDGSTCVSGQYENEKIMTLKEDTENPVVTKDGYALVFKGDTVPSSACMVKYGAQEWTLAGLTWVLTVGEGETPVRQSVTPLKAGGCTLLPLPDTIVTGELAGPSTFFQELEYQGKLDGTDTEKEESARSFYFNPHFAKTVTAGTVTVETTGGAANVIYTKPDRPAEPPKTPAYVRTARHLYDLSVYQSSYAAKGFSFQQELDIDYATYAGYLGGFAPAGQTMPFRQAPIGADSGSPFVGTYDGGFHVIQNVFFPGDGSDRGLFGVLGKSGESTLENVVYKLNPGQLLSIVKNTYVGALVGVNCGTIENCAVYGVNMEATSAYTGGLVGYNQGSVKNCAAELVNLSIGGGTAGGLVGYQGEDGIVESSYAVGRLENDSGGAIAGLVGDGGAVRKSYAAVDAVSSGDRYGLCGANTQTDTESGWLKDVFVYRGIKYNITATTDYKDSNRAVVFTDLKSKLGGAQSEAVYTVRNIPDGAGYGPAYEGRVFPYFTGVKTTLGRDPDTGKITGYVGPTPVTVHYGLWPSPLPVGLTYYETYSNKATCMSGQYENENIMTLKEHTEKPVVTKDGYALLFEGDIPAGDYAVMYGNSGPRQSWTLNKSADGKYVWRSAALKEQEVEPIAAGGYTLIPLPDKIVTGELSMGDAITATFYQKLVYGDGLFSARTFYFNPHFAGRIKKGELISVEAGSVEPNASYNPPDKPVEPVNKESSPVAVWASLYENIEAVWEKNAIAVRTARHFYALSRFQNTYVVEENPLAPTKRYYFKQALDLDYNSYTWYGDEMPERNTSYGYYVQAPIGQGTGDDGFMGSYNGGGHTIENVFYTTSSTKESSYDIHSQSVYIGLFRYIEYIANVHYKAPPNIMTNPENGVEKPWSESDLLNGIKVGTLIGGCFRASNCTATLLGDFTVKCDSGTHIFIGGLAGYSNKMHGCRAVVQGCLKYSGNVPVVYVGGLEGVVYQEVTNCTSKVKSLVVEGGTIIYAGGLVGGIAYDNPRTTTRVVAGCAAEIEHLLVDRPHSGESYAGGLIGRNIAGIIYASYAVGAIGDGDTNQNHHYSGLVGQNENKVYQGENYKIRIQNCYSAVGLPAGSENQNYNFCPTNPSTIQDCFYLTGTWKYRGKTYTALSDNTPYGTGMTYDELKTASLPECQYSYGYTLYGGTRTTIWKFLAMTAGETGYPFPVHTGNMLVRYGAGNFSELNRYEDTAVSYPGDDWPIKPT